MKLNVNKIVFMILIGIAIALSATLSALLLFTNYKVATYISLGVTYGLGIYFVKIRNKYPLYK